MAGGRLARALPLMFLLAACGTSSPPAATNTPVSSSTPSPSPTPQPPPPTQVLFAAPAAGDKSTLTWARIDGSAISTLTSGRSDATFVTPTTDGHNWSGISSSALSSTQLSPPALGTAPATGFAVLGKDGSVHSVPAAATSFLNQASSGAFLGRVLGVTPPMFITNGQLFAAAAASDHVDIDRVDLASGQIATLLTGTAVTSSMYFTMLLQGLSADGQQLSMIAANAMIGGHEYDGLSTVVMSTKTATWSVRSLPKIVNDAALPTKPAGSVGGTGPLRVFVSPDGTAAVYQTSSVSGGKQTTAVHEYSLATSTDTVLAPDITNANLQLADPPVLWSPDLAKIAINSTDPLNPNLPRVTVVDASTGKVLQNPPAPAGQRVMNAIGWDSNGNLLYASSAGNSVTDVVTTHLLTVSSGAVRDLPTAFGAPVAILY